MNTSFLKTSLISLLLIVTSLSAQSNPSKLTSIDLEGFMDSAHHWYDINDEVPKLITPQEGQKKYNKNQVAEIADNILVYQRSNGGWPKNYDMRAILTSEQKQKMI